MLYKLDYKRNDYDIYTKTNFLYKNKHTTTQIP